MRIRVFLMRDVFWCGASVTRRARRIVGGKRRTINWRLRASLMLKSMGLKILEEIATLMCDHSSPAKLELWNVAQLFGINGGILEGLKWMFACIGNSPWLPLVLFTWGLNQDLEPLLAISHSYNLTWFQSHSGSAALLRNHNFDIQGMFLGIFEIICTACGFWKNLVVTWRANSSSYGEWRCYDFLWGLSLIWVC